MPCNISHYPTGSSPVHVTYRLYGSIPRSVEDRIAALERSAMADARRRLETLSGRQYYEAWRLELEQISRKLEVATEKALHDVDFGPMHLRRVDLQSIVLDSWTFLQTQEVIELHAACVMSNHVHIIFSSATGALTDTAALLQRHKRFTARECNNLLGRTGTPFWAQNYFDRTIRRGRWLAAMEYVLQNPVKAGLVEQWEDYTGSYLNEKYRCHFSETEHVGR